MSHTLSNLYDRLVPAPKGGEPLSDAGRVEASLAVVEAAHSKIGTFSRADRVERLVGRLTAQRETNHFAPMLTQLFEEGR